MNKEQLVYILRENESLRLQVKRLEQSAERLQTRYYDTENQLNSFKRKYQFLSKQFKEVARQCFPREFTEKGISSCNEKDVYDFIISKIRELESGMFDMTVENRKTMMDLKETIEELERFKNAGTIIQQTPVQTQSFDGVPSSNEIGTGNVGVERPTPVDDSESIILKLMATVEEKDWPFIKAIGEEKTSFSDIATELNIANSTVSEILKNLQEKGIVNFEKIVKGGKGRPAHHYFLTPAGVQIYKLKFESDPSISMLQKLSTHGSPAHGGLMLEVGKFLEETGCEVQYDGPDTTYKLRDGRDIRFDIKAYDKESKELILIETERCKCGEGPLHEKFDKCLEFTKLQLTKTIYIVAPEKESLHKIQQLLFRWIRQQQNLKILNEATKDRAVLIFKTCALDDFKKGNFQVFFYGMK